MPTQDRAPAFPFYAKDWLADPKVQSLSFAMQGRYINCLASMWEYSTSGCQLPLSTARKFYGEKFISETTEGDSPILILSEADGNGGAYLYSNRLSQEAQKCRSRSKKARESALIMHEKRRAKDDANA